MLYNSIMCQRFSCGVEQLDDLIRFCQRDGSLTKEFQVQIFLDRIACHLETHTLTTFSKQLSSRHELVSVPDCLVFSNLEHCLSHRAIPIECDDEFVLNNKHQLCLVLIRIQQIVSMFDVLKTRQGKII